MHITANYQLTADELVRGTRDIRARRRGVQWATGAYFIVAGGLFMALGNHTVGIVFASLGLFSVYLVCVTIVKTRKGVAPLK